MNEKIIQIIPAPKGFYALYEHEDGNLTKTEIVCIGLSEDGGAFFLDYAEDGEISVVNYISNFKRIERL